MKLHEIDGAIRSACAPRDVLVVRTKHAITFVSEYPRRHIQIVLRLYSSPAEVLHGFDIDACCVGYDGLTRLAPHRAVRALMARYNMIDLSRCSPTLEFRLYKYAKRGFSVAYPPNGLRRENIVENLQQPAVITSFGNSYTSARVWRKATGLRKLLLLEDAHRRAQNIDMGNAWVGRTAWEARNRRAGGSQTLVGSALPGEDLNPHCRLFYDYTVDTYGRLCSGDHVESVEESLNAPEDLKTCDYSNVNIPRGPQWTVDRVREHLQNLQQQSNDFYLRLHVFEQPRAEQTIARWGTLAQALSGSVSTGEPDRFRFDLDEEMNLLSFKHVDAANMWRVCDPGGQGPPIGSNDGLLTGSFHPLPTRTPEQFEDGVYAAAAAAARSSESDGVPPAFRRINTGPW